MMAPTLVLDDGSPRLVLGSAGSVRLSGAILQVDPPRRGRRSRGRRTRSTTRGSIVEDGVVQIEGGWPDDAAEQLEEAGERVNAWAGQNLYFGGVSAVERRPDGTLAAAGDPRRGGHGVVVP